MVTQSSAFDIEMAAKKKKKKPVRSRAAKKRLSRKSSTTEETNESAVSDDLRRLVRNQLLDSFPGPAAAGTIKNRSYALPVMEGGQCYKNAFIFAVCNEAHYPGIEIVHGYPLNTDGEVMGHAWIEWRDFCYDPYLDVQVPRETYYSQGHIDPKECRRYPVPKARKLVREQSWGPWEVVRADAVFVETRYWIVNGPMNEKAACFWEELELDGLELQLRGSEDREELATELERAEVGDGDILLCYHRHDEQIHGICMVSRDQVADTQVASKRRYSYSVLKNQLEFDPPSRMKDLAANGCRMVSTQKCEPVIQMDRIEFRELVDAMSAQSKSMADRLAAWLDYVGVTI